MKYNKALTRSLDILEYVATARGDLSLTEIAKALNIPKSSAFDLLATLAARGILRTEDQRRKTYGLGLELFRLGARALERQELPTVAAPFLERFMRETGETVFLAMGNEARLTCLDKREPSGALRTALAPGACAPLHCTGLGKAFLAACPEDTVRRMVDQNGLAPLTDQTLRSWEGLMENLRLTRQRGYAVDDREYSPDLLCLAAPILDRDGAPVGALSVAGTSAAPQARREEKARSVMRTAFDISRRLGYAGASLYPHQ